MVRISAEIPELLGSALEDYFCELTRSTWGTEKGSKNSPTVLFGFFEGAPEAKNEWEILREKFPEIPDKFEIENIVDSDWQNAYKAFLKPWHWEDLDWVPIWLKDDYKIPSGDKVLYFDAGMAFGTGDHPTTRLCAQSMIEFARECGDKVGEKTVIDAGCGSGILALTSKLYGFGDTYGFDRDEAAVSVSWENAKMNGISPNGLEFEHAGIEKALENGRKADLLLANIQADVLCIYAEILAGAVNSGGRLVLSGILAAENERVKKYFEDKCADKLEKGQAKVMGDWSRIVFIAK